MITQTMKLNKCQDCGSTNFKHRGQIVTLAESVMTVRCRDCDIKAYWHDKLWSMIASQTPVYDGPSGSWDHRAFVA